MSLKEHTLRVALAERSYDIVIGSGLIASAGERIASFATNVIVVTDSNVMQHYGKALEASLKDAGVRSSCIVVPAGEGSKSFRAFEGLMEKILSLQPDRRTALVALGGGVIGDLTGFAASTLLRGVPFIQIPTSLLAQVDSSVGGKTAINTSAGKNLVGSFYQPKLVLADLDTLKTLPPRELRAGYAEIIKYGLIRDAEFYRWCLANGERLLAGDMPSLQHAVIKSCAMKAAIVEADEREADMRALLNFGHTFAHALEAETGFSDTLLHGEAVGIGMVMACRMSAVMGLIDRAVETELMAHFTALGMKAEPKDVKAVEWRAVRIATHFASDKKAEGGALTFVVLKAVGQGAVAKQVDPALALDVVESYLV